MKDWKFVEESFWRTFLDYVHKTQAAHSVNMARCQWDLFPWRLFLYSNNQGADSTLPQEKKKKKKIFLPIWYTQHNTKHFSCPYWQSHKRGDNEKISPPLGDENQHSSVTVRPVELSSGRARLLITCAPLLSVAVNPASDGFLKSGMLNRWDAAASEMFDMGVGAVSCIAICVPSKLYGEFRDCFSKLYVHWKKEKNICCLSIWQVRNWLGIHCHVQCHCLTWCLAASNRAQIERLCSREKGISCLHDVPSMLPWCLVLESLNRKETKHHRHVLLYTNDSSLTWRRISCTRFLSLKSLCCSVGCWRAFCKTEGLGFRAG